MIRFHKRGGRAPQIIQMMLFHLETREKKKLGSMAFHEQFMLLLLLGMMMMKRSAATHMSQAKPGCPDRCGGITIPYPFGIQKGCYLNDSYFIVCLTNKPYIGTETRAEVLNISLEGHLRISSQVLKLCLDPQGNFISGNPLTVFISPFCLSSTQNKLTIIGCDSYAILINNAKGGHTTGCISLCQEIENMSNGTCSGIGCCQSSIPKRINSYLFGVWSIKNHADTLSFSNCSYAWIGEEGQYNISSTIQYFDHLKQLPMLLDWAVGSEKCNEARKKRTYLCKENSMCYDADNGSGYLCKCSKGYGGNPYLHNGCLDINECDRTDLNGCTHICNNTIGSYDCSCPEGYHGDGRKGRLGCTKVQHQSLKTRFMPGFVAGLYIPFAIIISMYLGMKKFQTIRSKEHFFERNGGILLQKLLSENNHAIERAKIFTEDELKKATNNFSQSNIIGHGGYGTVYKGILRNKTIVAIKRSRHIDEYQIEQFVNEMMILLQINHKNIVKLLGCCLESSVPLLVYEYISNKTLFHHLHGKGHANSMPWRMRLRIAAETAEALAYMHSSAQIIHRDFKSLNVLLDNEFTAKVSDFGISRFISVDKTHLTTLVQGTFGYLDPEYFRSGKLTEKSDVYSFGVVLVELLTGKKVSSWEKSDENMGITAYFIYSLEKNLLLQVIDDQVRKDGSVEEIKRVAALAKNCLELKGETRPAMKMVAQELQSLLKIVEHPQIEA